MLTAWQESWGVSPNGTQWGSAGPASHNTEFPPTLSQSNTLGSLFAIGDEGMVKENVYLMCFQSVLDLFSSPQVAQHLASTYGDKAFEVAKIAQVTGKRWPIVGKRLVSEFPYIEAEVCGKTLSPSVILS